MRHPNEAKKIEAEIKEDQEKYSTSLYLEERIIKNIPRKGFAAACQRIRLLAEKQALAEKIRRNKMMLASARN
jgi:molybdenum cofactor biosynthesis enzyme MoaA